MIGDFLEFKKLRSKLKTKVYQVVSKSSRENLGEVRWYPAWRHYCFFPFREFETVYSDRCLLEISLFIRGLNKEHDFEKLRKKLLK